MKYGTTVCWPSWEKTTIKGWKRESQRDSTNTTNISCCNVRSPGSAVYSLFTCGRTFLQEKTSMLQFVILFSRRSKWHMLSLGWMSSWAWLLWNCHLQMHTSSVTSGNPAIKEVTYFSDTCGGQNRNQFVASSLIYSLHKSETLDIINHKFFERGHSHMESDAIHSSIEHAKKNTSVHVPSNWNTVILTARQKKPYIIVPVNTETSWISSLSVTINVQVWNAQ